MMVLFRNTGTKMPLVEMGKPVHRADFGGSKGCIRG